jgi:hypothetical protein
MKVKLVKIEYVDIDLEQERERIKSCDFSPRQRKNLLAVCDMLEKGEWQEADKFIDSWGRCPDEECYEKEYVCPNILKVIYAKLYGKSVDVTVVLDENA